MTTASSEARLPHSPQGSNRGAPGRLLLAVCLTLLLAATGVSAATIRATGQGPNRGQALNAAFQNAVEAALGTAIHAQTLVERGALVRDEIVTHSRGFVSSYTVVEETSKSGGVVRITVDAEVDRQMLADHYETLGILMTMAGEPRVLILGQDDDYDSIPASVESFDPLVHTVAEVFGQKFRFKVIDWPSVRARHLEIQGKLDPAKVLQHRATLPTDYIVAVKLNLSRAGEGTLLVNGVRTSDGVLLGQGSRSVKLKHPIPATPAARQVAAVNAARDEAYWASMDLARQMVEAMHEELDRGTGFRYQIVLNGFPDAAAVEKALSEATGYVRHDVKNASAKVVELAYWSNLRSDIILEQIRAKLDAAGLRYKYSMQGRTLGFTWKHPDSL